MAASSYPRAFAATLAYEGGYTNNPRDPGGPTNLGVTQATLSGWLGRPATIAEVKALTKETVAPIYRANYWNAVQGDALPAGVDHAVWDYGVNSGTGRAARALQAVLGIAQDGHIGPATLAALAKRSPSEVVNALCDARLSFLKRLPTWGTFGGGWSKRIAQVRRLGLDLALHATPATAQPARDTPILPGAPASSPMVYIPKEGPPPPTGFWSRFTASLKQRLGG